MQIYRTKVHKFAGTDFHEVMKKAFGLYAEIKRIDKEKWQDRFRRVKYFGCTIELIQKSRFAPKSKENPNNPSEILHRFYGSTADNEAFYVQIKEDKRTDQKFFISCFPEK